MSKGAWSKHHHPIEERDRKHHQTQGGKSESHPPSGWCCISPPPPFGWRCFLALSFLCDDLIPSVQISCFLLQREKHHNPMVRVAAPTQKRGARHHSCKVRRTTAAPKQEEEESSVNCCELSELPNVLGVVPGLFWAGAAFLSSSFRWWCFTPPPSGEVLKIYSNPMT